MAVEYSQFSSMILPRRIVRGDASQPHLISRWEVLNQEPAPVLAVLRAAGTERHMQLLVPKRTSDKWIAALGDK